MANFTTLKTDISDFLDNNSSELTAQLDQIIENAEDQLADEVTEDAFFAKETGSLSIGDDTVNNPTNERGIRYFQITSGTTLIQLERRELTFLREFFSSTSDTGTPKYFGEYDADNFLIAPSPSAALTYEIGFTQRLQRLSTGTTTHFYTTNAYQLLLYCCLHHGALYVKNPEAAAMYGQYYERALVGINRRYARQQITNDNVAST